MLCVLKVFVRWFSNLQCMVVFPPVLYCSAVQLTCSGVPQPGQCCHKGVHMGCGMWTEVGVNAAHCYTVCTLDVPVPVCVRRFDLCVRVCVYLCVRVAW